MALYYRSTNPRVFLELGWHDGRNQHITRLEGKVEVLLYEDTTPRTARAFLEACRNGELKKTEFQSIVTNYMCQGGVEGKEPIYEINYSRKHTGAGILSSPTLDSYLNKGLSEFSIFVAPTPWLDGENVVFGQVVNQEGICILERIDREASSYSGVPQKIVRILNCGVMTPTTTPTPTSIPTVKTPAITTGTTPTTTTPTPTLIATNTIPATTGTTRTTTAPTPTSIATDKTPVAIWTTPTQPPSDLGRLKRGKKKYWMNWRL